MYNYGENYKGREGDFQWQSQIYLGPSSANLDFLKNKFQEKWGEDYIIASNT